MDGSARARYSHVVLLAAVVLAGWGAIALGGGGGDGVIGPETGIQPSGRLLDPVGKTTELGNLPAGAALTAKGRFAWSLAAGRGLNEIQIIRVRPKARCDSHKKP